MTLGGPLEQNIDIKNGALANRSEYARAHGRSMSSIQNVPKENHPLFDAMFTAAQALTTGRAGTAADCVCDLRRQGVRQPRPATKEVIKYLQTNKIAVYGTLVGDSSLPVIGFLDHIHLPLTMRDNVLPRIRRSHRRTTCDRRVPAERHRAELCRDRRRGADAIHGRLLHA